MLPLTLKESGIPLTHSRQRLQSSRGQNPFLPHTDSTAQRLLFLTQIGIVALLVAAVIITLHGISLTPAEWEPNIRELFSTVSSVFIGENLPT